MFSSSSSSLLFSSLLRVLARGRGILEPDLWGQISVLLLSSSSSSSRLRVLARGGCPEKIAALRAGELRILARGAALKNRRASRERICESFANVFANALVNAARESL